jgi:Gram-negative bacterial TonB protein C-terminal
LNPAAVKAIMAQVFPPATQNGQPVEVWVVIPIVFRLR